MSKVDPMSDYLAESLREVLRKIDAREIPLQILRAPDFCNYPSYFAGGWYFVVFDDAGGWDYLEAAMDPSGHAIEYPRKDWDSAPEEVQILMHYTPEHMTDWGYPEPRKFTAEELAKFKERGFGPSIADEFFKDNPLLVHLTKGRLEKFK
jgi:hypothetical protein